MSEKKTRTTRAPSYAEAYLCVVLVFGLVIGAMILGVPVQATMLFASVIATVFAYRLGYSWDVLEKAIAGKLGADGLHSLAHWPVSRREHVQRYAAPARQVRL